MSKQKETYSEALERLELIVNQIDGGQLEIDQLIEKMKEANRLIAFCTAQLTKADAEIGKLLSESQKDK